MDQRFEVPWRQLIRIECIPAQYDTYFTCNSTLSCVTWLKFNYITMNKYKTSFCNTSNCLNIKLIIATIFVNGRDYFLSLDPYAKLSIQYIFKNSWIILLLLNPWL